MLYYNCSKGQEIVKGERKDNPRQAFKGSAFKSHGVATQTTKNKKICEKPLDNLKDLWYNKNVKRVATYREKGCVIHGKDDLCYCVG